MLKLLSIGNSFSQNAQQYLYGICASEGIDIYNANAYIGGCSFERHYNNMVSGERAYRYDIRGVESTDPHVSLEYAVTKEKWDVITLQEVSSRSYDVNKFEPYMSALAAYVREKQPEARIYLHMTWGYASDAPDLADHGFTTQGEMYERIKVAYAEAKKIIGADGIIPSGEVMQRLSDLGYVVHSDTHHASAGIANYALGLVWQKALFGRSPMGNRYRDFAVQVDEAAALAAQEVVEKMECLL